MGVESNGMQFTPKPLSVKLGCIGVDLLQSSVKGSSIFPPFQGRVSATKWKEFKRRPTAKPNGRSRFRYTRNDGLHDLGRARGHHAFHDRFKQRKQVGLLFLERLIFRWSVLSEPGEVAFLCYFSPILQDCLLFVALSFLRMVPSANSWVVVSGGPVHRDGVVDYSLEKNALSQVDQLVFFFLLPSPKTVFIFARRATWLL